MYSYAFNCLKRLLPEETVEKVKGMSITADGLGAVFDAPSDLLKTFLAGMSGLILYMYGLTYKCCM